MVATESFDEIYKTLCFGVKRTQRQAQNKAEKEASLRLRVLPEHGIETRPPKLPKNDVDESNAGEPHGVQLFSKSSAPMETTMKKLKKQEKVDEKAQRLHAERVSDAEDVCSASNNNGLGATFAKTESNVHVGRQRAGAVHRVQRPQLAETVSRQPGIVRHRRADADTNAGRSANDAEARCAGERAYRFVCRIS